MLFKDIIEFIQYLEPTNSANLVDCRSKGYEFFEEKTNTLRNWINTCSISN